MRNEITVNGQECKNIALDDNQKLTLSSELKPTKVYIWDKELCSGAQWEDFLKCVEEKTKENESLLYENKKLKRALKKACKALIKDDGSMVMRFMNGQQIHNSNEAEHYFIAQAEKEMKDGDID